MSKLDVNIILFIVKVIALGSGIQSPNVYPFGSTVLSVVCPFLDVASISNTSSPWHCPPDWNPPPRPIAQGRDNLQWSCCTWSTLKWKWVTKYRVLKVESSLMIFWKFPLSLLWKTVICETFSYSFSKEVFLCEMIIDATNKTQGKYTLLLNRWCYGLPTSSSYWRYSLGCSSSVKKSQIYSNWFCKYQAAKSINFKVNIYPRQTGVWMLIFFSNFSDDLI